MHAFVTGAGTGVGRAIAVRLASDGYAVTLVGRTAATLGATGLLISTSEGKAHPLVCDVASGKDVNRAVVAAEQQFGPLDVLVNNAGIAESAPFVSMDDDVWERTLAINLNGTYHCMRAVAPGMFARRRGRIINIASSAGDTAGMTEIGSIMIFECARQPGGTHIIEDHFIEETLEYDGDRPVPTASGPSGSSPRSGGDSSR